MMESVFEVKTNEFEGPLELLLDLIEQRKFFINDISLASVADDYISHINQLEKFPMREAASFVLIASTLLLIKSKSLLPTIDLTPEEKQDIHDLERRLALYKRIRGLSKHVEERFGKDMIFGRLDTNESRVVFTPSKEIIQNNMLTSVRGLIKSFPKVEKLAKTVVEKVMSLEEVIDDLSTRIQKNIQMSFKEFSEKENAKTEKENRLNIVVSFLALLELVKQGAIAVEQSSLFSDIEMATQDVSTPDYS